jgi:hypothetical protein
VLADIRTVALACIIGQPFLQQNKAAGVPLGDPSTLVDQDQANEDFLVFFEDLYVELSKFGRIEGLHVVENLGDHLIGK